MIYLIVAGVFGAIGLACLVAAWLRRSKRSMFVWAALSAGVVGVSAYTHVFWPVPVFTFMTGWGLFGATNLLNPGWRMKVGLSVSLGLGALLSLYPTVHDEIMCSERRASRPDSCPDLINQMEPEAREAFQAAAESGDKGVKHWLLANIPFRMVQGLDLAGGIRLVYTVEVQEAIKGKRDRYYDDLRVKLAKSFGLAAGEDPTAEELQKLPEHVTIVKPRDNIGLINLTFKNPADSKTHVNAKFLIPFMNELNIVRSADGSKIDFKISTVAETAIRDSAVSQAKETIMRRIDGMGVKEAAISTRDEDIIVEIPGDPEKNAKYFDEIRDIIAQTARLDFKMLDDEPKDANGQPIEGGFFKQFAGTKDVPGLDFLIENAPAGPGRSVANFYARLNKLETESMEDALKRFKAWTSSEAVASQLDQDHSIGFGKIYDRDEETGVYSPVAWRTYYLFAAAKLTGDMVRDAIAQADQTDAGIGQWFVTMNLNVKGGEIFEKVTEQNVKKRFAIILDGVVESAPEIREKIGGGTARITMGAGGLEQQQQDAKKLELVLRSGALPAPISKSNEQTIGASLGNDSIDLGMRAAGLGGLLVLILMFISYRQSGFIANFAVMFNLVLQLAVLSMFSASMTLPGIAGLALTVGMAVDANVLINERIKEELANGKMARAAVSLGYDKAFSAIIDGNATTLISGLILAQYGTGPIKGFAVTLIVGMLCNLFTGVVVTRLFFEFWVRGRRDVKLGIGA